MPKILPTPVAPALALLLNLDDYSATHPPREPFRPRKTALVWQGPNVRFQLVRETTGDIGYGLGREEALADHGVYGADHDSRHFAESLYAALEGELSLHNLRDIAEVFAQALAREEAAHRVRVAANADRT